MTNPLQMIRNRFTDSRLNHEEGNDIVITLFMLPFVLGLIFSLIDISSYFQVRSTVQNATRDGARQVALYGGSSNNIPLNTTGKNVSQMVKDKLYNGTNCIPSSCPTPPVVTCGPGKATNLNADAYCDVTYRYNSVGGNLVQWLGFGGLLSAPIKTHESFKVETKY